MVDEIRIKQPLTNKPQEKPFASIKKEDYKNRHISTIAINPLQHDSTSAFDDEKDYMLKKLETRHEKPSCPELTHPSKIFIAETLMAINTSKEDVEPIEKISRAPIAQSERWLEEEFYSLMKENSKIAETNVTLNMQEIKEKRDYQKHLHEDSEKIKQELLDRSSTSEALGWTQIAATVATISFAILSFAVSFFTGGLSAILGGIGVAAGVANGVVGGTNNALQLKTKEVEGLVLENKETRELNQVEISNILSQNRADLNRIHQQSSDEARALQRQIEAAQTIIRN